MYQTESIKLLCRLFTNTDFLSGENNQQNTLLTNRFFSNKKRNMPDKYVHKIMYLKILSFDILKVENR